MATLDLPPDVFAVVMATGIVSVAARDHAYPRIEAPLAALAAAILVLLVAGAALQLLLGPATALARARDPDVGLRLFTFVAACAVVGACFPTHPVVVRTLAVAAAAAWLVLFPLTLRDVVASTASQLRAHAHGSWLLVSVATAGLAITAAGVASSTHRLAWIVVSTAAWALAVVLYLVVAGLIAWRVATEPFVPEEVTPDSWILMGALAITTLAGADLVGALRAAGPASGSPVWLSDVVRPATLVLWILASTTIPVLVYAEIWRVDHRAGSVHFAGAWWSAVFPLGMYASATAATAAQLALPSLTTISLVMFWIAFSVWVLVTMGWLHSVLRPAGRPS
ncbi:MAG: tellurite resistance/C4-dicarboxylate transporter family protein [Mycobacteriaceae bacterium]